jgi:hypothetical protein
VEATRSKSRGLSSGSSLLAEMNGSEGGWVPGRNAFFHFREVKGIREDCPPAKEEGKKALSSISTSLVSRGVGNPDRLRESLVLCYLALRFDNKEVIFPIKCKYNLPSKGAFPFYNIPLTPLQSLRKTNRISTSLSGRTAQVSVRLRMRTSFPSAHSPFTRFSKQRRKGGQQVPRALCPTQQV